MDEKHDDVPTSSLRLRANLAQKFRCRSLVCVLENPMNLENIGSVIRNIDAFGVTMLYVVSSKFTAENLERAPRKLLVTKQHKQLTLTSVSANKWVYVHHFPSSESCCEYLVKNQFTSLVTSPHMQGFNNLLLLESSFTGYKKLAVWFGNEAQGISQIAVQNAVGCIQIEMCGIVESLNLAVSTGIILHFIASQRRKFSQQHKRYIHSIMSTCTICRDKESKMNCEVCVISICSGCCGALYNEDFAVCVDCMAKRSFKKAKKEIEYERRNFEQLFTCDPSDLRTTLAAAAYSFLVRSDQPKRTDVFIKRTYARTPIFDVTWNNKTFELCIGHSCDETSLRKFANTIGLETKPPNIFDLDGLTVNILPDGTLTETSSSNLHASIQTAFGNMLKEKMDV